MVLDYVGIPWVIGCNERWNNNFNELVAYDKANGSVDVRKSNGELGRWVHNQRQAYKFFNSGKKSTLTPERIERLESIGFKWRVVDGPDEAWNTKLELLQQYKHNKGHASVPRNDKVLGRWVATQCEQFKKKQEGLKSTMTDDRIHKLESINFLWVVGSPRKGCHKRAPKEVHQEDNGAVDLDEDVAAHFTVMSI